MRYRSTWTVWSLLVAVLILAGCLSDEEPVPKYDYGKSAERDEAVQVKAPRAPYSPDRAFRELDRNRDQALSLDEFARNARTPLAKQRETGIFGIVDRNGDDRVSLDEFKNRPTEANFRRIDLDCDGGLSPKEFYAGDMNWASAEQVERVFQLVDRSGNGLVEFAEYRTQTPEARYERMDRDGDGLVSLEEYEAAIAGLVRAGHSGLVFGLLDKDNNEGLSLAEFTNSPPEVSFYRRDANGDASLSLQEFLAWSHTPEKRDEATVVFNQKDWDRNGQMSLAEFKLSAQEARFRRLDSDRDEKLSADEFAAEAATDELLARAVRLFGARDSDQDGYVSLDEFKANSVAVRFCEMDVDGDGSWNVDEFHQADMAKASPEWARRTFDIMDRNGDGRMSLEEQRRRAWFMFIDADEDGSVTEAEYGGYNSWLIKIGHCKTIFDLMDKNKDGVVSQTEFNKQPAQVAFLKKDHSGDSMLSLEEFLASSKSEEKLAADTRTFHEKDFDGDGVMSVEEYLTSPEESRFRTLDSDKDGTLSLAEYGTLKEVAASESYAQRLFKARDVNNDGRLQLDEFRAHSPAINFATRDTDGDALLREEEYLAGSSDEAVIQLERDLFRLRDEDADGGLSLKEFQSNSRAVTFRKRDLDGDGGLDLSEFHQADMPGASSEWAQRAFQATDQDENERVSIEELHQRSSKAWFASVDADLDDNLSREEFAAKNPSLVRTKRLEPLFVSMDVNGDDAVSSEEFCANSEETLFIRRDNNMDGKLDFSEFTAWIRSAEKITQARSDFDRRDLDEDGFLSFRESAIRPEHMDFWAFDQGDDARLDLREFQFPPAGSQDAVKDKPVGPNEEQTGMAGHPRDSEAWGNFFASVDANADGQITIDEFRRQSPKWRFIRLDFDDDGSIASADYSQIKGLPELARQMAAFIDHKDVNNDGKLTVEEFLGKTE